MNRPSDTFDTCWLRNWHRHWLVVWSCPWSTTAMLCSTALPATASRSCSEYRTTQLGSFSRRCHVAEDVTLAARSAEDRLQSGSADVQSPQHIDAVVPLSPNPGPTTALRLVHSTTWTELNCSKSKRLHDAFIGHAARLDWKLETRTVRAQSVRALWTIFYMDRRRN